MLRRMLGSVGMTLFVAYLIIAALALAVAAISYAQVSRLNEVLAVQAMERAEARYLSTQMRVETLQVAQIVAALSLADSPSAERRLRTQFDDEVMVLREFASQMQQYAAASEREQRIFSMILGLLDDYLRDAENVFAVHATQPTEEQLAAAQERLGQSRALLLDQLVSFESQQTSRLYSARLAAREAVQRTLAVIVVLAAVVVLGGVIVGTGIVLYITRPIGLLVAAARRVAEGDLTSPVAVRGGGDIGLLARTFDSMVAQLRGLIGELEERVEQRTRELERRSSFLEASAEVASAVSSVLDRDRLIRQVVDLIRERFDLYYVGLFLVDEEGEWAWLRAGTGEAGQAMLARGHKIKVGTGMVGWAIANAQARIALDVGEDAVRLATAELPKTRSEAALPLRSRGRVIGALTVQSDRPAAFDQATVVVLQTMADQVAVALDNARLFAEAEEALEAMRRAYGEMGWRAWRQTLRAYGGIGYHISQAGLTRLEEGDTTAWRAETRLALESGRPVQSDDSVTEGSRFLSLPVRVRGEIVAVLDLARPAEEGPWTTDEVAHLETLADQLGVAMENARLLEETRRRAQRDRIIADITARVRASQDMETILRTAVRELGTALGTGRTFVQLSTVPTASVAGPADEE
jgi:GAF domain-containing protein/HAMP domain-containing protein